MCSNWKVKATRVEKDGTEESVSVALVLEDTPKTKKSWDHSFHLEYTVSIKGTKETQQLCLQLAVHNNSNEKPFSFTTALHTYFRIIDVTKTTVHGLKGLSYIDKVNKATKTEETNECVSFTTETDRVYLNAPGNYKPSTLLIPLQTRLKSKTQRNE